MIYCVKAYINKEKTTLAYFNNLLAAERSANYYEDSGYICDIEAYEYHKTLSKESWRGANKEQKTYNDGYYDGYRDGAYGKAYKIIDGGENG